MRNDDRAPGSAVRVRPATSGSTDVAFLREMLYEAVAWRPDSPYPDIDALLSDPKNGIYIDGWGRYGDDGVIAEIDGLVGAAWYRLFTDSARGYGFIATTIPEVTIAVAPSERRYGVGTALLNALIERAACSGLPALSLSVERDNHAATRLYDLLGFRRAELIGNAWTMRLDLPAGRP